MTVLRQAQLTVVEQQQQQVPDPISVHVTRWLSDPYARGSWTFYGKGSSPKDVSQFRSNSICTNDRGLFFAGEHTCYGTTTTATTTKEVPQRSGDDMGCVHGAWVSGELAAEAAWKRMEKKQ